MKPLAILAAALFIVVVLLPLPAFLWLRPAPPPPDSDSTPGEPAETDHFKVLAPDGQTVTMGARTFILGAVSCEMAPSYQTEALKAQTVAAYTYYCVQRQRQQLSPDSALGDADFADVPGQFPAQYAAADIQQRWGAEYDRLTQAVDAVFGQMVLYQGAPIVAVYHAISSGETEDAQVVWGTAYPYLVPVASPGDRDAPGFQTTVAVTSAQLQAAFPSLTLSFDGDWLGALTATPSGTVTEVDIGGTAFTGFQLRAALGLRSACFTITRDGGTLTFTVDGYGHDVGMSQYGANYLAGQGLSYREILQYYYTGVDVE